MERLGLNRNFIQTKRRKIVKRKAIIFIICVLIPLILFDVITKKVEPALMAMCTLEAQNIGILVSNEAIGNVMDNVVYEDLVILEKDSNGKLLALRANVTKMTELDTKISDEIQLLYGKMGNSFVKIPLGNFTGNSLLAGLGPNIKVKIVHFGTVTADFKSEFTSTGINQVRHRIYLEIETKVSIVAPLMTEEAEVVTSVNIAETILIGDVPESFYGGLNKGD